MPEASGGKEKPGLPNEVLTRRLKSAIGSVIEDSLKTEHPNVARFVEDAQGHATRDETPDFIKLRNEFVDSNKETEDTRWKGFDMIHGKLREGTLMGKAELGLGLMTMINKEGERKGDHLRLGKMFAMLEEGSISLAQLQELRVYFKIIEARCCVMKPDAVASYPKEDPPTEREILACELIDGIGRLIGNPLVKAILEKDADNRERKLSHK